MIGEVYDWLGFDIVADKTFRNPFVARMVKPTSKLDAGWVLTDLGAKTLSYRTNTRHVDQTGAGKYRDVIAGKCFSSANDCGASAPPTIAAG